MTDLIPPRIITLEAFEAECERLGLLTSRLTLNEVHAFDEKSNATVWFPKYALAARGCPAQIYVVMQPVRCFRHDPEMETVPADMPWNIRELWKQPDSFPISKGIAREILDYTDIKDFKLAGPKALQEIIDRGDEQIAVEDAIEAYACIDLPEEVLGFIERAVLAKYNVLYLYRD